jgi:3-hydroxyacyl-CoA dehydrogenase
VIEAVFENMDVKKPGLQDAGQVCKPGAILASNTSYLNVDQIADFTKRPQDVVGLHFFSPANVMKLLEVVRGARPRPTCWPPHGAGQEDQEGRRGVGRVRRLHRQPHAGALRRGAAGLLNAGALPQQVDAALQKFGMAMGPFRMGDLAGLDIGWATRKRKAAEAGVDPMKPRSSPTSCASRPLRPEDRRGWYRYEARRARPHPRSPGRQDDRRLPRRTRHHAAQDQRRRDRRALHLRAGQRRRAHPRRRHRRARVRHRHRLPQRLRLPAAPRRPHALRRHRGPGQRGRALRRFAAEPGADAFWQPAPLLVPLAEQGKTFN